MRKLIVIALFCSAFYACKNNSSESKKADLLAVNLDSTIKPGEDFFEYANGGWIKKTPIPGSESGWGIGNLVQDEIYTRLKNINEKAITEKNEPGSISQKIADFWQTAMDTVALDKAGITPLQPDLDRISSIKNPTDIIAVAADLHMKGINCLFSDYVAQDDKNSEKMAYKLDQGGLGMPNREYYFKTDERTGKVRTDRKSVV